MLSLGWARGLRQATGHICNKKVLFADELVPSFFSSWLCNWILVPNLMGTVILWVTDDKETRHSFTLSKIYYLPNSPVNILSLCHLAELYPNDDDQLKMGQVFALDMPVILCIGTKHNSMIRFKPLCLVFQNAFLALDIQSWKCFQWWLPMFTMTQLAGLLHQR